MYADINRDFHDWRACGHPGMARMYKLLEREYHRRDFGTTVPTYVRNYYCCIPVKNESTEGSGIQSFTATSYPAKLLARYSNEFHKRVPKIEKVMTLSSWLLIDSPLEINDVLRMNYQEVLLKTVCISLFYCTLINSLCPNCVYRYWITHLSGRKNDLSSLANEVGQKRSRTLYLTSHYDFDFGAGARIALSGHRHPSAHGLVSAVGKWLMYK